MGLIDLYRVIRRRWLTAVAVALVCLVAAVAYVATIPTTYTASTRLYVSMATGTSVNDSYQGGLAAQQRITSYSYMVSGITVAQRVVDDLGLPVSPGELQGRISATFPPATTLLDISVTDSTPEGARALADSVAAQFRRLVGEMETTVAGAAPAVQASVVDPAQIPTEPTSPDSTRFLVIGLLGGLALGCLAAFVRDRLDRRVWTAEQLTEVLPPVLASVPDREPDATKAMARLGTRLTSACTDPAAGTVMLTSFSGRSQPAVAVRLSKALADTGRRVVLVDADVSGDGASAGPGMVSEPGVAEWLRAPDSHLDDLLKTTEDGIGVVPLGGVDERTSGLLGSERFAELLSQLRARFDYVLVDTAPTPGDRVPPGLSVHCDGTLAVVELGSTSIPQLRAAEADFGESGSGLIGAVAVAAPSRRQRRHRTDRSVLRFDVPRPPASVEEPVPPAEPVPAVDEDVPAVDVPTVEEHAAEEHAAEEHAPAGADEPAKEYVGAAVGSSNGTARNGTSTHTEPHRPSPKPRRSQRPSPTPRS